MKLVVALVAGQLVPSTIRLCVQTRAAGTLVIPDESSGSCVSGTSSGWRKHKHNPIESGVQESRATPLFLGVALESFASLPDKAVQLLIAVTYHHVFMFICPKGCLLRLSVLPLLLLP